MYTVCDLYVCCFCHNINASLFSNVSLLLFLCFVYSVITVVHCTSLKSVNWNANRGSETSNNFYIFNKLSHSMELKSLRSCWLLCQSRNSLPFIKPGGLLLCLQELTTGPYPEPVEPSPHPYIIFLKLKFSVIWIV
jgi:hypothetical protein